MRLFYPCHEAIQCAIVAMAVFVFFVVTYTVMTLLVLCVANNHTMNVVFNRL